MADQATLQACEKVIYTVQANDTLSSIANNYAVPQEAIKSYNGLAADTVFLGMNLIIPLCERTAPLGPTSTPHCSAALSSSQPAAATRWGFLYPGKRLNHPAMGIHRYPAR
jgi:spore germination protein YaaH